VRRLTSGGVAGARLRFGAYALMTLLICKTCPRYDIRRRGEFADRFRNALAKAVADHPGCDVSVRAVQCLGGCPADGVVALDAPCKTRVRFTGLSETDAAAVARAAVVYDAAADGHPDHWSVPVELLAHLSSITPKRGPQS
jgi:predicted metal-binding protein